MKFEHTLTSNWVNAFRGLRNPMNSWDKSDSYGGVYSLEDDDEVDNKAVSAWIAKAYPSLEIGSTEWYDVEDEFLKWLDKNCFIQQHSSAVELFFIGPNDMDLAQRMIRLGSPNDKFLRQIFVSVDITAPLYWWKEMSTYKIATTANSTSTMHKITSTPITMDSFETDNMELVVFNAKNDKGEIQTAMSPYWIITYCEELRQKYLETKEIRYWRELIRWLPESWLQTRTWTANYSVLRNIIKWRTGHKLTEWAQFIEWCKTLPYAEDLLFFDK